MPTTILHVENDPDRAQLVRDAFEAFGFHGTTLNAATVREARELLDDMARGRRRLDLVICDTKLPDGTGLDLVRLLRENPACDRVPILILSGDVDPTHVGRAYALGANAYVAKGQLERPFDAVIKTLYDHWFKDVLSAGAAPEVRAHQFLSKSVSNRGRIAAVYLRIALQLPAESEFWQARALGEANLANLMAFVQQQIDAHDLPAGLLTDISRLQEEMDDDLAEVERDMEQRPGTTADEAFHWVLEIASASHVQPFLEAIRHTFPVVPTATVALRDLFAASLGEIADWIDGHTANPALRGRLPQLRATAAELTDFALSDGDGASAD